MDCSCDALYGDTGLMAPGALIDAAKICWHDKCQHAEGAGSSALDFSYTGRRSAGRPRWELIGRRVCRRLSRYRSR
jgi:hypothetical protein